MAEQVLIQFRADKQLKQEVTEIYDSLGMDLPTAFRMFMKRSVMERGLPFEVKLPEDAVTRMDGLQAFREIREILSETPEMSLDQINAEIKTIREEGRANEK